MKTDDLKIFSGNSNLPLSKAIAASIGIKDPKMDKRGYPYELMKKKDLF